MAKKNRQHNGQEEQTTQWPRRTDNTMAKNNRQHNGQEEQTTQWPRRTDNTMAKRKGQTNNDLQNMHIKLKIE
jgi:hypothetical protein